MKNLKKAIHTCFKYLYSSIVLFGNIFINKIPSRHFRRWFYKLMGAKIGKSYLFRLVEVLSPKELEIGDFSTVGWFSLLDSRGGIKIGNNVCVASYVKLITGSHKINSPEFDAIFKPIVIEDYAWICTGATIVQGVRIGEGAVVAAGSVVTHDVKPYTVVGGVPAKEIATRIRDFRYHPKTPFLH